MLAKMNTNREISLDALRGFALWGICVVNLPFFSRSWESFNQPVQGLSGQLGVFFSELFFEGKFFTIFSFLFGISLHILLRQHGLGPTLRRLVALFVLGLLHSVFLFPGDILLSYGLLGMLFLLIRNGSLRTLLSVALISFLFSLATYFALGLLAESNPVIPPVNYLGTYLDALRSNVTVYPLSFGTVMLFNWPGAACMFCLGYLAAREGWLEKITTSRVTLFWLAMGLTGSAYYAYASASFHQEHMAIGLLSVAATVPVLSLAYAQLIFMRARRDKPGLIIRLLSSAGRMSLTNYILQSVLAGLIFHGYGLGLYNKINPAGIVAIASGIFLLELIFSAVWLRFFAIGPMEWILRSVTHAKLARFL